MITSMWTAVRPDDETVHSLSCAQHTGRRVNTWEFPVASPKMAAAEAAVTRVVSCTDFQLGVSAPPGGILADRETGAIAACSVHRHLSHRDYLQSPPGSRPVPAICPGSFRADGCSEAVRRVAPSFGGERAGSNDQKLWIGFRRVDVNERTLPRKI